MEEKKEEFLESVTDSKKGEKVWEAAVSAKCKTNEAKYMGYSWAFTRCDCERILCSTDPPNIDYSGNNRNSPNHFGRIAGQLAQMYIAYMVSFRNWAAILRGVWVSDRFLHIPLRREGGNRREFLRRPSSTGSRIAEGGAFWPRKKSDGGARLGEMSPAAGMPAGRYHRTASQ